MGLALLLVLLEDESAGGAGVEPGVAGGFCWGAGVELVEGALAGCVLCGCDACGCALGVWEVCVCASPGIASASKLREISTLGNDI